MKFLLPILLLMIISSGCAQKNAFKRFQLSDTQELAEDNLQSSKIMNEKAEVIGVVTAVYLNKINPKLYNDYEYFYIYLYAKEKNDAIRFSLNGIPSLLQEELPAQNEFTTLTAFNSKWNKYYLVGFAKQQGTLNLKIQIEKSFTMLVFKQY
jgi:hypothetical protein